MSISSPNSFAVSVGGAATALDRSSLARRLHSEFRKNDGWVEESRFKDAVAAFCSISPSSPHATSDLGAVLAGLSYFGLVQYRRNDNVRQMRAMDPAQRERELREGAGIRTEMEYITDERGDEKAFPRGTIADAEKRRVRGVKARAALAELKYLEEEAKF